MIIRTGVFINNRYEIIDKVGSGGMADVYKAKCHRLNRFVAIKVLKAEFSNDAKFVEKFRAEAQSAAGLSHPNIVNVYDVGEEEGMHYIVMELVEGITLKSFIERKGKLDVKEAVGIAVQIAQGMEAAHGNHIVHRDIKPQNIIISREGKVKVTDFGIAKAVSSDTITSNAMGSVHYLSPEQARGGFSDEKSDIYSLGVTLYEMLSGRVPFVGDNTVSVALCHLQEDAIPLRDLDRMIPVSLDRIVQKCMQKKPEHRYLTASELIADLKKSLSNPDGAYVSLFSAAAVDNSPTISLSEDDLQKIKQASSAGVGNMVGNMPGNMSGNMSGNMPNEDFVQVPKMPADRHAALREQRVMPRGYQQEKDEYEEDEDVNPKLEKIMSAGGVLMAIIIVFILIFIVVKASGLLGGGNKVPEVVVTSTPEVTIAPTEEVKNTVPYVEGLELVKVKSQLQELGLLVEVVEEHSDTVEAGYIISQDLEPGTVIEEETKITLKVSAGLEKVTVPDVANKSANEASTLLQQSGFIVVQSTEYSETVEKGKVTRTNPQAGSEAVKGETITMFVSDGPEDTTVEVPNLSGCTIAQAQKKLAAVGLELADDVGYVYDDVIAKDKVVSQSHTAGTKVDKGTKVAVTLSLGKEPVYRYIADISIQDNPFTSEAETGTIKVILKQDGKTKTIYEESHGLGDFPLYLGEIEGYSDSDGEIYVYLDGTLVAGPYAVTFEKVEE